MVKGINFKSIISVALAAILVFGLAATGFAAPPQMKEEAQTAASAEPIAEAEQSAPDIQQQASQAGEPERQVPDAPQPEEEVPAAVLAQEPVAGMAANFTLSGVVKDEAGSPIDGVQLDLYNITDSSNAGNITTTGGGGYSFSLDSDKQYRIDIVHSGYNRYKSESIKISDNTTLGITIKEQKVVGTVSFSPSFASGTVATAYLIGSDGNVKKTYPNINATGKYEFSKVINGDYTVKVVADGYKTQTPASVSVSPQDSDISVGNIVLEGVKVKGTIKDNAPTPVNVKGVKVILGRGGITKETTTDSNGEYTFDTVTKGAYTITIDHEGYSEYSTPADGANVDVNITSSLDENANLTDTTVSTITLKRIEVKANIMKRNNGAADSVASNLYSFGIYSSGSKDAYVEVSPSSSPTGYYSVYTDTNANKPIKDSPIKYDIKAKLDTYITGVFKDVSITKISGKRVNPLNLGSKTLEPMRVYGQLLSGSSDVAGNPGIIPRGTTVTLLNKSGGSNMTTTTAANDGIFSFEYVPNAIYSLQVKVDGYILYNGPEFKVEYEEAAIDLRQITLDPTTISGKVTDKNQNPIVGAQVTLYKTSEVNAGRLTPVIYAGLQNPVTVGSDGSYKFRTVPNIPSNDSYTIIARKNSTHWENSINGVSMDNSSVTTGHQTGHDIIMRPLLDGFEVHGKVFNENNVLMPGAYVRIFDKNGDQVGKAVQTGSNGVYSFEKIQPDTGYVVKAANRGYALGKQPVSVVDKDVTVGDIKMTRQVPVYFKGAITDTSNSNKGVAGLTVKIFAKNSTTALATATTDAAGKYTFTFSTPTTQLYIGAPYIIETQYKAISGKMYPTSKRDFDYMGWDEEDLNIKISPQDAIFRISGRASLNTMQGSPVPFDGAKVRLEHYYLGTMGETVTAMDGTYNLYDLPAGLYNVYVSKDGFLKNEKKVETVQITDRDIMALDFVVTMQNAVSIGFDKELYYVGTGSQLQLGYAVQPPEAGLDNVIFVSSNPAIATVDSNGRVKGISAGETEITARVNDSTSIAASCKVKVVKGATKVNISNETKNMFVGSRIQLKASVYPKDATLQGITWKSDNTARVTIDSGGYMRGVSRGRALITATSEDGLAVAQCIVTVKQPVTQVKLTRSSNTVTAGSLVKIHTQVRPSNANDKTLSYTSKNTKVATVDKEGRVKGVSPGKTDIIVRATDGSGVYARFTITVNTDVRSVAFSQDNMRLVKGMRRTANYVVYTSGGKVKPKFSSSNPSVVQVDANGKLYAYNVGEAIITASASGITGTKSAKMRVYVDPYSIPVQSISISGAPNTMRVKSATWLSANFNPTNATDNKISWKSSNRAVLDVNKDGKLNAKKAGTAVITATAGGVSRSVTITVKK